MFWLCVTCIPFVGIESNFPSFYNSTTLLTMCSDAHSMHLDPTVQVPRRASFSSEWLSPSGLGLSLPLPPIPVPPHLRETFAAGLSRAGSPALSTFSNSFQYQNEPHGADGSDESESPGLNPYPRHHNLDRTYNGLTRDFLTHRAVRSSSFRCLLL